MQVFYVTTSDWVPDFVSDATAMAEADRALSQVGAIEAGWPGLEMGISGAANRTMPDVWTWLLHICGTNAARVCLEPIFEGTVEWLPIRLGEHEQGWILHLLDQIPALDLHRSIYSTFRDGRVMRVKSHWFTPEVIGTRVGFRVPQQAGMYVTDRFKDVCRDSKLVGLDFKLLWDSAWTVTPVPVLILSGYWSPRAWPEAESARRSVEFLHQLGDIDPALAQWQTPGTAGTASDCTGLPLTEGGLLAALRTLGERGRNSDAIYHDGGIPNLPDPEIGAEFSLASGTGDRFVNSPWGGVAHLRMFDLREARTRHASPEGVLRLFEAFQAAWPVEHLVARTELHQRWPELKEYPVIGWMTQLRAPEGATRPDPRLPDGVRIVDRRADRVTIQLASEPEGVTTELVAAVSEALEAQGWIRRQPHPGTT